MAAGAPAGALGSTAARAPELVSTAPDNLGDIVRGLGAADAGGTFAYTMDAASAQSRSAMFSSGFVSQWNSDSWLTAPTDPAAGTSAGGLRLQAPVGVSSDFKRVLVSTPAALDAGDQDEGFDLYEIDVASGEAMWLSHGSVPDPGGTSAEPLGGSRDLHTVYFKFDNAALMPGVPDNSLYEWHDGAVSVASVLPDGTYATNARAIVWPSARSGYQSSASVSGAPGQAHGGAHLVSDDGSTLYFYGGNNSITGYFARRDGVSIQIGLSQRTGSVGDPAAGLGVVAASHDGDVVDFFSDSQLSDAADNGGGLYRYVLPTADAPAGVLTLLTPDGAGKNDAGLGVADAMASDDMSHVYFVATAALVDGATAGQQNLYVNSDGQTKLITTLPGTATVERVSRSGRFAVIQTTDSLAGATTNAHVTLYRYDDQTGELGCISCRPDGTSESDASLQDLGTASFAAPASPVRNIADDGTVFFASGDRLVPADVTPAWDVYEYTGSSVQLLSSGRSEDDSYVQDNSDDGTDAFFVTSESLVPADDDGGLSDVYDARRGGAVLSPAAPPAPCVEDCQRPAEGPRLATPASMVAATPPPVVVTPSASRVVRTVRFGRVTPSMRRQLERGRTVGIPVVVTGGGRVTLSATARSGGSTFGAGTAVRRVHGVRRVTTHVSLRLSARARGELRRRGSLRVVLTVRLSGVSTPKHKTVVLERRGR